MSICRLNYTNRIKLNKAQVGFTISRPEGGLPLRAHISLQLPTGLPPTSRVFVEASRSSPPGRMRFDLGSIESPVIPPYLELADFDTDALPLFRLKVTSPVEGDGRILAEAHHIHPLDPSEPPETKRGILLTQWRDNDGLVWDLDLKDDRGPILYIDHAADPNRDLPRRTEFRALVYPEIIRRVLTAVVVDDPDEMDDPERWPSQWVRFPRHVFGFSDPLPPTDDEDARRDWVDSAVRWCSRKAGFINAIAPAEVEE